MVMLKKNPLECFAGSSQCWMLCYLPCADSEAADCLAGHCAALGQLRWREDGRGAFPVGCLPINQGGMGRSCAWAPGALLAGSSTQTNPVNSAILSRVRCGLGAAVGRRDGILRSAVPQPPARGIAECRCRGSVALAERGDSSRSPRLVPSRGKLRRETSVPPLPASQAL